MIQTIRIEWTEKWARVVVVAVVVLEIVVIYTRLVLWSENETNHRLNRVSMEFSGKKRRTHTHKHSYRARVENSCKAAFLALAQHPTHTIHYVWCSQQLNTNFMNFRFSIRYISTAKTIMYGHIINIKAYRDPCASIPWWWRCSTMSNSFPNIFAYASCISPANTRWKKKERAHTAQLKASHTWKTNKPHILHGYIQSEMKRKRYSYIFDIYKISRKIRLIYEIWCRRESRKREWERISHQPPCDCPHSFGFSPSFASVPHAWRRGGTRRITASLCTTFTQFWNAVVIVIIIFIRANTKLMPITSQPPLKRAILRRGNTVGFYFSSSLCCCWWFVHFTVVLCMYSLWIYGVRNRVTTWKCCRVLCKSSLNGSATEGAIWMSRTK